MIHITPTSWQPVRAAWILDWLNHKWSILLGLLIKSSTAITYSSATNSYLTFCNIHHLPIDLTPDTLSLYITFQLHLISATSIDSYLSRICNQLEPFFPDVQKHQASMLVKCTLKGARHSNNHRGYTSCSATTRIPSGVSVSATKKYLTLPYHSIYSTHITSQYWPSPCLPSPNPRLHILVSSPRCLKSRANWGYLRTDQT